VGMNLESTKCGLILCHRKSLIQRNLLK